MIYKKKKRNSLEINFNFEIHGEISYYIVSLLIVKIRSLNGTIMHYNKSWKKRIQIPLVFELTLFVMRLHSVS